MKQTSLTIIGILIAILAFGIKTGVGCGFSNVKKGEIIAISSSYFILSVLFGNFVGLLSPESFEQISSMGMGIHVLLSLFLIGAGIYTQKKWHTGHDVSRKTFLVMSIPCPVCLAALAFCCMLLAASLEWSGIKIGLLVGTVFFIAVLSSSFVFRKLGKTPETLGSAMLLLGIYYLLGAMLIPAYMKTKQLNLRTFTGEEAELIPLLLTFIIVFGGFLVGQVRYKQ
ncbi:MAG: DUF2162 family putative transporter [Methanosarcinaceae archaeon]|nr:DUF2162 family putative transporter [Methanosarcinaceae archaeon]